MSLSRSRTVGLALTAAVVLVFLGYFFYRSRPSGPVAPAGPSSASTAVVVGANLPLSGAMAFYGTEVQRGLDLALAGSSTVKVAYEDNHSVAKDSVTVFQLFAGRPDVPVVISSNSPLSAPLRDFARRSQRVLLALVTGAERFAADNPWVFRDAITQSAQAPPLARYAYETLSARRAVTLVVNDDYGLDGARAFVRAFTGMGGEVVREETFQTPDSNLRAQLTKLKAARPQVLFVVGREQNLIAAVTQAVELDVAPHLLSVNAFDSPAVIAGTGRAAERVVFTSYDVDLGTSEEGRRFRDSYVARHGSPPSIYAIDAYAAGKYLAGIANTAGASAVAFRDSLTTLRTTSIKGPIVVTPERDIVPPIGLFRVESGEKKPVRALPLAKAA